MNQLQRRYATEETFREVANMLFGGGADDLVHKLSPEQKKKERRQTQAALAGNVLGLTAGGAALATAYKNPALKTKTATKDNAGPVTSRALKYVKTPKGKARLIQAGAIGAVGLQAANTGGDIVGNVVLRRQAKKEKLSKSEPGSSDVHIPTVGTLKRVAGKKAIEKAPEIKRGALKVLSEPPEISAKVKQYTKEKVKKSITWEGEISKVDTDKRQVFGWASIVEMNGAPVVDLQGDYIDIDEIEKSAYDYVIKSRKGGEMHRRDGDAPVHVSDMIESFLVTPEKKQALGLPDEMPTGWWVGYQINDDEAWNLVKSGKRTGFSIHGRGQRTNTEI